MRVFRRRGKYGNRKVKVDGYTMDSQAEAQRYTYLKLLQMAGEISNLEVHEVFELQPLNDLERAVLARIGRYVPPFLGVRL